MPNLPFQIHPTDYRSLPCQNHYCTTRYGTEKYFLGHPDTSLGTQIILCEHCVNSLLNQVPAETLLKGEKLHKEITQLVKKQYTEEVKEYGEQIEGYKDRIEELLAQIEVLSDPSRITQLENKKRLEPVMEEVKTPETKPPEENLIVYRCLDCNAEFADKDEFKKHKKIHK